MKLKLICRLHNYNKTNSSEQLVVDCIAISHSYILLLRKHQVDGGVLLFSLILDKQTPAGVLLYTLLACI